MTASPSFSALISNVFLTFEVDSHVTRVTILSALFRPDGTSFCTNAKNSITVIKILQMMGRNRSQIHGRLGLNLLTGSNGHSVADKKPRLLLIST